MVYGVAATVQKLVWGAAKSTVPDSVTEALVVTTIMINAELNLRKDLAAGDKPATIDAISNLLAAGMIQEQREPKEKSQNTIKGEKLLEKFKDQTTGITRGEPYHIKIVEP